MEGLEQFLLVCGDLVVLKSMVYLSPDNTVNASYFLTRSLLLPSVAAVYAVGRHDGSWHRH
eukprot:6064550-Pleurochrysis_carterae.AAC.1